MDIITTIRADIKDKREDIELLQLTEDYLEKVLELSTKYSQSAEERIRIKTAMRYNSSVRCVQEQRFAKLISLLEMYGESE